MILEAIRSLTDGLANATYGVNVKLASLQLDGSDVRPSSIVTIADETRDSVVARNRLPQTLPGIAVALQDAVTADGEVMTSYRDATITMSIRYGVDQSDTDIGNANIYYVMRAIEECLKDYHSNANASDRLRNNVIIGECTDMQIHPPYHPNEDNIIVGGLSVTYKVRDIAP